MIIRIGQLLRDQKMSVSRLLIRLAAIAVVTAFGSCTRESATFTDNLSETSHEFEIYWLPKPPEVVAISNETKNTDKTKQSIGSETDNHSVLTGQHRPLLHGWLEIMESGSTAGDSTLAIKLMIDRPSSEADRKHWNSQLEFADVPWMDTVRIWDSGKKWQWPNLPFLLRRHGQERVERYGGVDPGKQVDNDFAAVLIRKYDATGNVESEETRTSPLVSAEWHGADSTANTDSIIHSASSDTFQVNLAGNTDSKGKLRLWLVYADFLNSRPPSSWPRQPEWAGGILAYFEIDWQKSAGEPSRGTVRWLTPPIATGFNWEAWSEREFQAANPRLNDAPIE